MFKTLLKVGTTFALLLGCYFGYVRAFNLVVRQFQDGRGEDLTLFPARTSKSKKQAIDLATLAFGADHWTVTTDQPYAYYNSERGYWMYWKEYEEIKEENGHRYDGKRVRMWPFAMIGKSGDGKSIMRLTAETATLDLNQPIGLGNKQGTEAMKVEHAKIEGDVWIRDDRGTPDDPADDLKVGPLTHLDYDDGKRMITSTSHVVIVDPDQTATGDGLEIRLRKPEVESGEAQTSSSSGFAGVEYAILQKNPRVAMRDVGDSGFLPDGGARPKKDGKSATTAKTVDVTATATAKDPKAPTKKEPVPLIVQSQGPMRVDWPPDRLPVVEGPPQPPSPTLVRFERDVVALHGRVDRDPNQLNCDTLRLTLIPGGPPPAKREKDQAIDKSKPAGVGDAPAPAQDSDGASSKGLFGNLTLQKAHATGYTVWLQMRAQGTKVRCNEMIHERNLPYRPDWTFFRGDKTRPIWMEKLDFEPEESGGDEAGRLARSESAPRRERTVRSVTHVRTISATIYDRGQGNGLDLADVRAYGPGKLESRPDPKEPVDRIAEWQDELLIVNVVGPDGKLQQKQITLTGTRPYFVDLNKKTSLDAAQEIKIFLKPRSTPTSDAAAIASAPSGADRPAFTYIAAKPPADAFAADGQKTRVEAAPGPDSGATSGLGNSLQIERLLAYRDVHFLAPNRRMEARVWLDAPFIEFDPAPVAGTSETPDAEGSSNGATDGQAAPSPGSSDGTTGAGAAPKAQTSTDVAAKDAADPTAAEPTMTGVADRIFAKVAMPRGQGLDAEKSRRKKGKTPKDGSAGTKLAASDVRASGAGTAPAAASGEKEAEAEIREAWLRGNVALHQDAAPDPSKKGQAKSQGDDIFGEAVYLDNKGEGKLNARVYHRDPTDPTPLPGPIRWARVSTEDMIIYGETLWMDQEHDKVWAYGPGTLSQWTDRALLTDKAPEPKPAAAGSDAPPGEAPPGERPVARATGASASTTVRTTGMPRNQGERVAASRRVSGTEQPSTPQAPARPRTRAGRPVGDKDLLFISWSKAMEFNGRSKDTTGHPAGRADFYGAGDAKMTDALLHWEQKMIAFTDREVPLKQLGSVKGGPARGDAADQEKPELPEDDENGERTAPARSRVDIAMIYCFGNPTAITRKVHPDVSLILEKERIDAWDHKSSARGRGDEDIPGRLDYNRRTGDFYVPGPGIVYMYNRPEDNKKSGEGEIDPAQPGGPTRTGTPRGGTRTTKGRTVVPTSGRTPKRGEDAPSPVGSPALRTKLPDLVLMQIEFSTGMRGRMGTGQAEDTAQERWSEFFGDIELLRSKVAEHDGHGNDVVLDADSPLSEDGFYLTSQMLRVIQEPPPPGSPAETAARNFAKAWDKVHINKGETLSIESDVATYDSATNVIWAYGQGENGVTYVHQTTPGQPLSQSHGKALQYNLKTRSGHAADSNALSIVDHRTGSRPSKVPPPDPTAPPKKKRKTPFKVPNTNLERRGFTGY